MESVTVLFSSPRNRMNGMLVLSLLGLGSLQMISFLIASESTAFSSKFGKWELRLCFSFSVIEFLLLPERELGFEFEYNPGVLHSFVTNALATFLASSLLEPLRLAGFDVARLVGFDDFGDVALLLGLELFGEFRADARC